MIKLAYCNVENLDLVKVYPLLPQNRKEKWTILDSLKTKS